MGLRWERGLYTWMLLDAGGVHMFLLQEMGNYSVYYGPMHPKYTHVAAAPITNCPTLEAAKIAAEMLV